MNSDVAGKLVMVMMLSLFTGLVAIFRRIYMIATQADTDRRQRTISHGIPAPPPPPGVPDPPPTLRVMRTVVDITPPLKVQCAPVTSELRCPYCRDALSQEAFACAGCDTMVHKTCYEEHGACVTYGCAQKGKPVFISMPGAPVFVSAPRKSSGNPPGWVLGMSRDSA